MDTFEEQIFSDDYGILTRLGWQVRSDVFVNSGVMFLNDTSGARQLANVWHAKYLECAKATGAFRDQPALNTALAEVASFAILPHRYNAQFGWRPDFVVDAVVLHFFSSGHFAPTRYDNLAWRLLQGEPLRLRDVESLVRSRSASYGELSTLSGHPNSGSIQRALSQDFNIELVARLPQLEAYLSQKDAQFKLITARCTAAERSSRGDRDRDVMDMAGQRAVCAGLLHHGLVGPTSLFWKSSAPSRGRRTVMPSRSRCPIPIF